MYIRIIADVLGLILSPGVARAQDRDYVLSASDAAAEISELAVVTVSLTAAGDAVTGYQFELCHESAVTIDTADIDMGSGIGALAFSRHVISLTTEGWAADATLDTALNVLRPAEDIELYLAAYEWVDAGSSALTFCESEIATVISTEAGDATPVTVGGSIELVGPSFLRGDANGDGVVEPLGDALFLLQWAFGDLTAPPCLAAADANDNGGVSGLLDALYLLGWGFFDDDPPPDPGPERCGPDPNGIPSCLVPPDPCPGDATPESNDDYLIAISDAAAAIDGIASVDVSLMGSDDIQGCSFAVCDDALVSTEVGNVLRSDTLNDFNGGNGPSFFALQFDDEGFTLAFATSLSGDEFLDATEPVVLVTAFYNLGSEPGTAAITFCELENPPVKARVALTDQTLIVPALEDGSIEIVTEIRFLRGDVDNDGTFESLADPLHLLAWAFLEGPEPPCFDATDADDNGVTDGLVDPIFSLNYAFTEGEMPPAPGPDRCGPDPTDDALGCAVLNPTCN